MTRFNLTVKEGEKTIAYVLGRKMDHDGITRADLAKVIEVEQFLEKLTGLRVHIGETS